MPHDEFDLDMDDIFGDEDEDEDEAPRGVAEMLPQILTLVAHKPFFSTSTIQKGLGVRLPEAEKIVEYLADNGYCTKPLGDGRRQPYAKARNEAPKRVLGDSASAAYADSTVVTALSKPVSVSFLSQVWGMDRKTIVKRLVDLPPADKHRGHQPLYDFRQAAQYLVLPRVNVENYIKKMGVEDLPKVLQKDVWDARLKEQTWKTRAGELWPTDDVLAVLGEVFQRLKTTTQLWIDQITDDLGLSAEVRTALMERVDSLQADLHQTLVEMPQEKATRSHLAAVEDEHDG